MKKTAIALSFILVALFLVGIFGSLSKELKVATKRQPKLKTNRARTQVEGLRPEPRSVSVPKNQKPAEDSKKMITPLPPRTRLIRSEVERQAKLAERVIHLESSLKPGELQIFYTDRLLEDWIIRRDDWTEGVGWSGLFSQIERRQRHIGIFAVVSSVKAFGASEGPTKIKIVEIEEL